MATHVMSDSPDIHPFPATRLGALLRAIEDPEGKGTIDASREREIATIEQRIAEASGGDADRRSQDTREP